MTVNLSLNLLFDNELCNFSFNLINAKVESFSNFMHINDFIRANILDESLLSDLTDGVFDLVTEKHIKSKSMLDGTQLLLELLISTIEEVFKDI